MLAQLKGVLAGEEFSPCNVKDEQRQINKLMTELQLRRRLGWVKNQGGKILNNAVAIAEALLEHWDGSHSQTSSRLMSAWSIYMGWVCPPIFK